MIFILPSMQSNLKLNQIVRQLFLEKKLLAPHYLKYPQSSLGIFGNFNNLYWQGAFGENQSFSTFDEIQNTINQLKNFFNLSLFDMSNISLTETDVLDTLGNLVLTQIAQGAGAVLVSNQFLYEYITEKYPSIQIIASKKLEFLDNKNWDKAVGKEVRYTENLQKTKNVRDILNLEDRCNNCPIDKQMQCLAFEDTSLYTFSRSSVYSTCNTYTDNLFFVTPEKDLDQKVKNGIAKHYQQFLLPKFNAIDVQIYYYVSYLFNTEYQNEIMLQIKLLMEG